MICILASLEVSVEHNTPRKLTAGESWLSTGGFVWGNKRVGGGENWGWKGQRLEWEAERVRGCCPLCFLHTAPSTWISCFPICVHQAASFSFIRLPPTGSVKNSSRKTHPALCVCPVSPLLSCTASSLQAAARLGQGCVLCLIDITIL